VIFDRPPTCCFKHIKPRRDRASDVTSRGRTCRAYYGRPPNTWRAQTRMRLSNGTPTQTVDGQPGPSWLTITTTSDSFHLHLMTLDPLLLRLQAGASWNHALEPQYPVPTTTIPVPPPTGRDWEKQHALQQPPAVCTLTLFAGLGTSTEMAPCPLIPSARHGHARNRLGPELHVSHQFDLTYRGPKLDADANNYDCAAA